MANERCHPVNGGRAAPVCRWTVNGLPSWSALYSERLKKSTFGELTSAIY